MFFRLKSLSKFLCLFTLTLFLGSSLSTYAAEEIVETDLNTAALQSETYPSASQINQSEGIDVGTPAAEAKDDFSGGFKKVGRGFKNGAKATGRGFKKAGVTTGRAFKKAGVATGRGFKKFGVMVKNFFTGKKSKQQENSYIEESTLSSSQSYEESNVVRENQDLDAVGNETLYE